MLGILGLYKKHLYLCSLSFELWYQDMKGLSLCSCFVLNSLPSQNNDPAHNFCQRLCQPKLHPGL